MHHWYLRAIVHAKYVLSGLILLAPVFAPLLTPAYAFIPQVQNRFDQISDSTSGATATHLFGLTYTDMVSQVGSVSFEFCANSPLPQVPCVAPSGLDVSSSILANQTGQVGFSIHTPATTQNHLLLTRTPTVPQSVTSESRYRFDDIVNPDTAGSYYVRLQTFASQDGTGPALEDGGVVFAINDPFTVSTEVPPYIKFCSSVTIVGFDCDSATSFFIDMGEFDVASSKFASSEMVIATNAGFGYSVSLSGTTLTSGNNVIPALQTPTSSNPGLSQFGLNLRANSAPGIGTNPKGPGVATPTPDYNTPNRFKFEPGDIVISGSTTTDNRKFTASYITNVSSSQDPGIYATTISFIALANF